MTKHKILYENQGENSDTAPNPIAVWSGQVDLATERTYCLNWDNDMLVKSHPYSVVEILLPDWLPAKEWICDAVAWSWVWGFGADPEWPEMWQRSLKGMDPITKGACITLLKTKSFRSEFRAAMRGHLVEWLETPQESRKYPRPFSHRQLQCLVNTYAAMDYKNRDTNIYRRHRYSPMVGVGVAV